MSGDNFKRNHCVKKSDPDYMLASDEAYSMQFTKVIKLNGITKYCRSTVTMGHKQFMEVIELFGISDAVSARWTVWQAPTDEELVKNPGKKGRNVPYNEMT